MSAWAYPSNQNFGTLTRNREYINLIIANKKKEYEKEIIRLTSENKEFTANTLGEDKGIKPQTVNEIFLEYIDLLITVH